MVDIWWLIGCMSLADMVMLSYTTIARGQMVHGVHASAIVVVVEMHQDSLGDVMKLPEEWCLMVLSLWKWK